MLDIAFIRQNPGIVKKAAADKRIPVDVDRLLALDTELREGGKKADTLRAERNKLSKEIPALKGDERNALVERVRQIKEELAAFDAGTGDKQTEFDGLMLRVPSVPAPEVPVGAGEEDNVEIRRVGEIREFDFTPRDHVELCEMHDLLDTQRGAKVSGSRFYYLKNEAVILEMAICRFVMDTLHKRGFTPMIVPHLVREAAMRGTGYFPILFDQAYKLPEDDLFLTGTSEVTLVSYHADEILPLESLPLRYAGYSTCYRREAGTYGKDTRGLYRVHQFQKVEQVIFCEADHQKAEALHYEILGNAEAVMQMLELPYRVCLACTGEIGLGQIRKHEIETWMPSREAYSETHSCSTMGDFQARRGNIRYRAADGEMRVAFTLNNTAIASPRILIPLLEAYQNADGSITVPEVLRPYTGFDKIGR
ncbi:MAG: serine--tRNA ligase [Oscillospiraceae bacterium]|jgi:seryl-tRNA synthetase|nr:serine--tRNA ligase [Oscillospiraceae bacterium]